MEKDKLPPGDSLDLEILFSTRTYYSLVTKHPAITVIENEADTVTKHITLTVNVYPDPDSTYPIVINPRILDLSPNDTISINHIAFEINNVSDTALHPALIDYPADLFTVIFPAEILPGQTALGSVTLTDEGNTVEFEKSITIEIDDSDRTHFTIPVKRVIRMTP